MSKDIELYIPELPNTPGWVALNAAEQEKVQELTSNAVGNLRKTGLLWLQFCLDVGAVYEFLKNKPVTIQNWYRTALPQSMSTGKRALAAYKRLKQIRGMKSMEPILYLAQEGIAGMGNIQGGEVLDAVERNPPPADKKDLPAWKGRIAEKLKKGRQERRKKQPISRDAAVLDIVLSIKYALRAAQLDTKAQEKAVIKEGVGYAMDQRAIPGSVTIERTPAPEGFVPRTGRPRIHKKTKKAA